jgi:hypothetical protein
MNHRSNAALALVLLASAIPQPGISGVGPQQSAAPVKIAVFEFELEDVTPASTLLTHSADSKATLELATRAAREALESSGRYSVVDASATPAGTPPAGGWHNCDGCEAAAAARIGADQSMLGIVNRATQTDYYVIVEIRDAHSGKLLDQQAANFAGDETGWPSGVRMLMKHQVLAVDPEAAADPPPNPKPPLCKVATVSPVSGYAECIDPPGAPVPPPDRP